VGPIAPVAPVAPEGPVAPVGPAPEIDPASVISNCALWPVVPLSLASNDSVVAPFATSAKP
jgi:hypothetical protein